MLLMEATSKVLTVYDQLVRIEIWRCSINPGLKWVNKKQPVVFWHDGQFDRANGVKMRFLGRGNLS